MTDKLKPCPRSEFVSDWIVKVAEKDNGAVFMKCTKDENLAPVTYGDLRKLMVEDYIHNTRPIEDRQRELMKKAAGELTVLAEMCDHYLSDDDRSRIATLSKRLEASDE